ncbi:hypothetical protein OF83DRAFT_1175595 [Amylostereum chailletii]|nr:hypothetical protein OF83DRAFT_1175595 [Amylostereum chailletii]
MPSATTTPTMTAPSACQVLPNVCYPYTALGNNALIEAEDFVAHAMANATKRASHRDPCPPRQVATFNDVHEMYQTVQCVMTAFDICPIHTNVPRISEAKPAYSEEELFAFYKAVVPHLKSIFNDAADSEPVKDANKDDFKRGVLPPTARLSPQSKGIADAVQTMAIV